jgi:hypothetical protein
MWILAEYEATAFFTLKPATATSSGGKTLLIPTPFTIKMALLDAVLRMEGRTAGEVAWPVIRTIRVAIRPARQIVVNNTFTKIWKPRRHAATPGTRHAGPFGASIGYREYAYIEGPFGLGLEVDNTYFDEVLTLERMMRWLIGIQYLGKRGSFIQLLAPPQAKDELPASYIKLDGQLSEGIPLNRILHQVDDCNPQLSFAKVDVYSQAKMSLGKDRVLHAALLPYRVQSSSRGYTYYVRVEAEP